MGAEKAEHYHKNEKLNCAQSVLKAFQEEFSVSDEALAAAKAWGGGKAPDAVCGALYSALTLAPPCKAPELKEKFIAEAGSMKCPEIRKLKKLSCTECVKLAASLLESVRK